MTRAVDKQINCVTIFILYCTYIRPILEFEFVFGLQHIQPQIS
jgi:hypothetical protein